MSERWMSASRDLEGTRPKPSLRERLGLGHEGPRRPERLRSKSLRGPGRLLFTTSEWCLLASIVCGLVAAGIAYTSGSGNALTGALAILAVVPLLMGMLTFWRR
jgi:hypothetical protein